MDPKPQTVTPTSGPMKRSVGKTIATIGVGMIALSIILVFAGVSGAVFHNVLQVGGLVLAIVGVVVWRVLKK